MVMYGSWDELRRGEDPYYNLIQAMLRAKKLGKPPYPSNDERDTFKILSYYSRLRE